MSCAVCGGTAVAPKLRKGETLIVECGTCGLAWWRPPADFRPEAGYDAGYFGEPGVARGYDDYAALAGSLRRTFARRLRGLPREAERPRLLDIGAAYGYAVAEALCQGFDAFGIEIARSAARVAAAETGARIAVASGSAAPFASACFDVITLWDVIEHMPDPRAVALEARRLLRPGGRLLLTTGDAGSLMARVSGARWHLYTVPEHLFFFTRRSLRVLLEATGFELESVRNESAYYTVGYLVERLRKTLLGRRGSRSASWPGAGIALPVNLFDIVEVRARAV